MKIPKHLITYKQIYLSLLLFIIIFCILGIPFTNWGFKTDDWGNIYHCTTRTLNDLFGFFYEKSMEVFNHPSNAAPCEQAFFCGLYRPISFIYYAFQYIFFGNNPYGYFLALIGFHAFSSVALFNIFLKFSPYPIAFLAALYFGFHPSLWNWLGWVSAQTYFIELFVLLILLLLLKYFIDHRFWWAYVLSCVLFLSNLFLREQTVFLPLWIIFAIPIYKKIILKKELSTFHYFLQSIIISLGYWLASIFYLIIRLHQLPLTSNTTSLTFQPTWQSFITRMSERTFDFVSYVVDMYGLSFMPNNHQMIKGALVVIITCIILFCLLKNKSKIMPLFLVSSILLFSWPALLMHCQPRYSYMALPFFIVLIITLLPFNRLAKNTRQLVYLFFIFLIINNGWFLYAKLKYREVVLHHVTTVFKNIVKNPTTNEKALCFFALPSALFHEGTAQAIWLLRGNNKYQVFQYDAPINLVAIKPLYEKINPLYITWDYETSDFSIIKQD